MARTVCAVILLFLVGRAGYAQGLCGDSTAIKVDTIHVDLLLSPTSTISWEAVFFATSRGGNPVLSVSPSSITFLGDGTVPNGMTTVQIFDLVARTSVARAVASGRVHCSSSCAVPDTVKVSVAGCVERTGTGINTRFAVCLSSGCCVRLYAVCCPKGVGSPTITLLNTFSPTCTGLGGSGRPCESTCN
jgi:hypothetical protein